MRQNEEDTRIILIVEDDESTGEFFVLAISEETSYHVQLVTNGADALEFVQDNKPCLIILDYHLPDMTGIELFDQLHVLPHLRDVNIVLMSASQRRDRVEKRNIVVLDKPFELDEFIQTVERYIAPLSVGS